MLATWVYTQWEHVPGTRGIRTHSFEYFVLCTIGGVLSGLPHTILTPMDLVKCRVQVGEYACATDGYIALWAEGERKGIATRLLGFYRGWGPTLIGYSLQGAAKFGLYEFFKYQYALAAPHAAEHHRVILFLTASASAEVFADVGLAPWEAVKIKVQTTRIYPPLLSVVVPRVWAIEGLNGFFKGLVPLWGRQVPYTMMKFCSFEAIIGFIYSVIVTMPKSEVPKHEQLMYSLMAGFMAGVLCALVSHPADSLVSKLNQKSDNRSLAAVVREMGCAGLWKGLVPRMLFVGTLTAMQWVIYDSFKVSVGLQTTGGGAKSVPAVGGLTPPPARLRR